MITLLGIVFLAAGVARGSYAREEENPLVYIGMIVVGAILMCLGVVL